MRKVLIMILLITVLLNATTVFGAKFSDTEGHWAEKVVDEMATKGILNGFEDGTFKPNDSVTREQFAKILVESLELKEKNSSVEFLDVENERWSKAYIETASKYLTGYTNNGKYYFRPAEATVREDVAVAVVMAKGLQNQTPNYDLLKQFSDEDKISSTLRKYIAIAVEYGIMQGKGGYFDPQGNLTRAEVSQLIYNVYTKVVIGEIEEEEHVHETMIEYVYKNETRHTVKTICKICEEVIKNKTEKHEFYNGLCDCGAEEKVEIALGDINGDGKVTSEDASLLFQYSMLPEVYGSNVVENVKEIGDLNEDNLLDIRDSEILTAFIEGKINKLPHKCTKSTTKYENVDEENHKKIEFCKCGEELSNNIESHKFENGECDCGVEEKVEIIMHGDVNGDGKVTSEDASLLFQYSMLPDVYGSSVVENVKEIGDLNEDNLLDIRDSNILTAYIEGKINKLPHECVFIDNVCACGMQK